MSTNLDVEALLEQLVRIDSRNPELSADSPGERPLAEAVAEILDGIGADVNLHEVIDGRPNVIGTLHGDDHLPTIVLEAHLDTVPTPPGGIDVRREGDRLYGRGSADTKGSLAAMIVAAERLQRRSNPRPTVMIVGAADEEYVMKGARALLDELPPVDGIVIGEPTSLIPIRAHNGFIRVRMQVRGVTAHSSKAFLGVNAIVAAARCVITLEDRLGAHLRERHHPLTGQALLTSTMIDGGVAPNVVPDRCSVWLDRRLSPGERPEQALAEIEQVLDDLRRQGHQVELDDPLIALPGLETAAEHPFVHATETAVARVQNGPATSQGVTYSTDACYLNGFGDHPCVVLGPGSIDQAHTDDEWIELDQVRRCVDVYEELLLAAAEQMRAGTR